MLNIQNSLIFPFKQKHYTITTATKLLELINKVSKVAATRLTNKNQLCFYISEQPEKEIQKPVLFTIGSKRAKYLKINQGN